MASQVIGAARSYHRKARFIVEIQGFPGSKVAFQKCSDITIEAKKTEHWEGGAMFPFKGPSGRVEVPDVTLDRGVTSSTDAYTWMLQVADIAAQVGLKDKQYTRDVSIVQLDLDGEEISRWNLFGCWPMKFKAGDWDNASDDVVIEQLVLCYDYPVYAGQRAAVQI